MRWRRLLLTLACLVLMASSLAPVRGEAPPGGLPSLESAYLLPPHPTRSPRIANYTIEVLFDPVKHTVDGTLVLEWLNTSGKELHDFPFHLYWNAFRNNLSTSARGGGRRAARLKDERDYGWMDVRSIRLLGESEEDLLPTLRYVTPDNPDDRTVAQVRTSRAVAPGSAARVRIEWTARIPHGHVGRAGWVHDYNFIVQWFPKIGVWWKDAWNCHPFYATTEFFSDFGVYDVSLTLPRGFVVGATGRRTEKRDNPDGTETLRYVQEDVHDFAWTASRRFLDRQGRFADPGYPPVDVRLLLQPEHAHLAERYIEATKIALRSYGAWSAPYPYPNITVVDPAWGSGSGGMEYPTLLTGGASVFAPPALQSPEGVTIHEAGHQFWYGLVANNEFEEAWLDEGFNSYHDGKAAFLALGPQGWGRRYFGPGQGRGRSSGIPVVAPGVWLARGEESRESLRAAGRTDVMARRAWEYRNSESYRLNSYGKPSLTMQTLEGLVGDETMTRILRTYARRYRFGHPTTEDFIATVNEVTAKDWRWFFDETFFSSNLCDYAIAAENKEARSLEGFAEKDGKVSWHAPAERRKPGSEGWESEVTVRRLGEVRLPVDVLVEFADGTTRTEAWDGRERWARFRYQGPARVTRATVDPEGKIALDVKPANNAWIEDTGPARRAGTKWAGRFLFWLQNLLELHLLLG
ncbi:MAG: M1 family metallopeptidase [Solirubrobacterales bacterium]